MKKIVKCINVDNSEILEKGKFYEIVEEFEDSDYIKILVDGKTKFFYKERFVKIVEERKRKLKTLL